jgi:SP family myo-inositol transporter-like MFS transporter 13
VRGRLVTILSLFITGGQVVAYIVGWLFSTTPGGWRWIVGIGAFPAFFQLAILAFLPETPRWLVQAGLNARAKTVLTKIYQDCPGCDRVVDRLVRDISGEIDQEASEMGQSKSHDMRPRWLHDTLQRGQQLLHGGNRRALIIAMMLQAVQQLCGFNSLMYFSATIFASLSFSSPTLTSLSVAMTNFIFTLLAFVLIDKIGRRRILLYSIPIMVVALIVCAFSFSSIDGTWNSQAPTQHGETQDSHSSLVPLAILFCLTVYTAAYALGLGNVPWQQSELFPLNVRSLGSALATATNWGSNFIIGLTFLPMMEFISPSWTFALYALVCVVGWVAVWAIYPEMSGLGLEDVKSLLADSWGVKESLQRRRVSRHL